MTTTALELMTRTRWWAILLLLTGKTCMHNISSFREIYFKWFIVRFNFLIIQLRAKYLNLLNIYLTFFFFHIFSNFSALLILHRILTISSYPIRFNHGFSSLHLLHIYARVVCHRHVNWLIISQTLNKYKMCNCCSLISRIQSTQSKLNITLSVQLSCLICLFLY